MLSEGQKFGEKERYVLVRQLGRGGFSEVWLADDSWTNIQVAIKVYAPGTGLDDAGIQLFTQEFSLVFDMNHTNLLKPTYFDSYERQPYLIMPLCKNGSAFKYVAGQEQLPEEECWRMLHDVAAGLAYLHAKNPPLIHQDIKPDNILISDEGLYMITDFGISARVRSTIRSGMAAQEQSGGTLAYMGPERFSSRPRPIMASDIWSLGAMMYEIICGNPPFGNNGGLMQKKGAEIPVIEDENISAELKNIIYSCLNEDPAKRPWASAIEEMTYKHLHGMDVAEPAPVDQMQQTIQPNMQQTVQPNMQQTVPPNMQQTVQPINQSNGQPINQSNGQPFQQSNGQPGAKGSNVKMMAGIAVAVVAVIIGLVVLFSGGDDKEEVPVETPVEAAVPAINLDSIVQLKVLAAEELARKAADFQNQYGEELLDSAHGIIEEYYLGVINKYEECKAEISYSDSVQLNNKQLETTMQVLKDSADARLLEIYQRLVTDAAAFEEIGSTGLAERYKKRAETIRPYVDQLLPKE